MSDGEGPPCPLLQLQPGTRLGRYIVDLQLGAGGMGVVYAAHDRELEREVALKVLQPRIELAAMQQRLRHEAIAMARLSHPNVVPVFDIGEDAGQLFIAMELVVGPTLRGWLRRARPWRAVVALFLRAGRGLAAAHAVGLVHRDFKPENVLIGPHDEPRITDFGLALALDSDDHPGSARSTVSGTPAYMAPEQLRGSAVDAAADQFSFCVSLFEALHGQRPFADDTAPFARLLAAHHAGPQRLPRARLPGWLSDAIGRGLACDAAARWPSMTALLDALERGLDRRRRAVVLAMVGAGALATGSLWHVATAPSRMTCIDAAHDGHDDVTIDVCRAEFERTRGAAAGAELASALRRANQLEAARSLATELLHTPARADALYVLGKVAFSEGRRDDAARELRDASTLHREAGRWRDVAADLIALASTARDPIEQLSDYTDAARAAAEAGDARSEAYAHIGAAVQLSAVGLGHAALAELDRAAPALSRADDRLRLALERGNVYQNLGEHDRAIAAFALASASDPAGTTHRALSIHLNLAYSLTESGREEDARAQLARAASLDPENSLLAERLSIEARIDANARALDRAASLAERAAAMTDAGDVEDKVEREVLRAQIALEREEPAAAEAWARRAIEHQEASVPHTPVATLRDWMVTDHRLAYEALFASQAAAGRAGDALATFERMHGLDVLAGRARADLAPDGALAAELAARITRLAASALAAPEATGAALDGTPLVVLAVARGDVWRISSDGDAPRIARIARLAELRASIARLRVDRSAATAELAARLVPASLARPSTRALRVVLDAPLAEIPIDTIIVARPVTVVPRLAPCPSPIPRLSPAEPEVPCPP